MPSRSNAPASAEPSTHAEAPNSPPTPEEAPDPTTGSGRTAYFVPTFLGNNVARGEQPQPQAEVGSSSQLWPKERTDIGAASQASTPRPQTPVNARATPTSLRDSGEKEVRAPQARSRIARTGTRTSQKRTPVPAGASGGGRTVLLLGLGVLLLGGVLALGLFILPAKQEVAQGNGETSPENGTVIVEENGEERSPATEQPSYEWPEGNFPRFTSESELQRTLHIDSPVEIRAVRVNEMPFSGRRFDERGFRARLLKETGEPLEGRLSHQQFQIAMELEEGHEIDDFELTLEHAEGAFSKSFAVRIDREPPRVRFTQPAARHRLDPRHTQPENGRPPSPFLLNERETEVQIRIRDLALDSVHLTLWDDRRIEVEIEQPNEVLYEERFEFPRDGRYPVTIEARDQAGNVAELRQEFIVDTVAPSFHIASSDDGSPEFTVAKRDVTVVGYISDDNGVRSLRVGGVQRSRALDGERGDTRRRFEIDVPRLRIGENRIELTADDMAGNAKTITLVITRTDPDLPRLVELRLGGRSIWREGREMEIQLDREEEGQSLELEIAVLELQEPVVRVQDERAVLDEELSHHSEFVYHATVEVYDGMQLVLEVDGRERVREFAFLLHGETPEAIRTVAQFASFELEQYHPSPQQSFRTAADFDFDGQRVVTVTEASLPELLVYDEEGELSSQTSLSEGMEIERVRWVDAERVAISTTDGELGVYSLGGEALMAPIEIEPGSDWHVGGHGLLAAQLRDGDVLLADANRPGETTRLPMEGRADGALTTLGQGRYLLVARGGSITAWSVATRRVVASLAFEAQALLPDFADRGVWYAVAPGGGIARFEGLAATEPVHLSLPGEIRSLTVLADNRLVAQVEDGEEQAWHIVEPDLSADERLLLPLMPRLRRLSEPNSLWALFEGYVVRLRLVP